MAKNENKNLKELLEHFQTIDPLGAVILTAAGVAGLSGVRGPLTTVVMGLSSSAVNVEKLSNPVALVSGIGLGPVGVIAYELFGHATSADASTKADTVTAIGCAAGNIVEAGLLYALLSNPETLKMLMDMARESAKGAIGLGKAGAAILGG